MRRMRPIRFSTFRATSAPSAVPAAKVAVNSEKTVSASSPRCSVSSTKMRIPTTSTAVTNCQSISTAVMPRTMGLSRTTRSPSPISRRTACAMLVALSSRWTGGSVADGNQHRQERDLPGGVCKGQQGDEPGPGKIGAQNYAAAIQPVGEHSSDRRKHDAWEKLQNEDQAQQL